MTERVDRSGAEARSSCGTGYCSTRGIRSFTSRQHEVGRRRTMALTRCRGTSSTRYVELVR